MKINETIICPKCNSKDFNIKHQATYLYTYKVDMTSGNADDIESQNLPFLFDNREQTCFKEYIECNQCGIRYPCSIDTSNQTIDLTIMRKAIRADNVETPGLSG